MCLALISISWILTAVGLTHVCIATFVPSAEWQLECAIRCLRLGKLESSHVQLVVHQLAF